VPILPVVLLWAVRKRAEQLAHLVAVARLKIRVLEAFRQDGRHAAGAGAARLHEQRRQPSDERARHGRAAERLVAAGGAVHELAVRVVADKVGHPTGVGAKSLAGRHKVELPALTAKLGAHKVVIVGRHGDDAAKRARRVGRVELGCAALVPRRRDNDNAGDEGFLDGLVLLVAAVREALQAGLLRGPEGHADDVGLDGNSVADGGDNELAAGGIAVKPRSGGPRPFVCAFRGLLVHVFV